MHWISQIWSLRLQIWHFFSYLALLVWFHGSSHIVAAQPKFNYLDALNKSILYFEGQRSGKLPSTQRQTWRADSGLQDGLLDAGFPLVGGYYDAGDNVVFGFPMAFTMTMLAWSVIEYAPQLKQAGQFDYAIEALKWGTDFMVLCHSSEYVYWAQVGEGPADHGCWQRPEDQNPRRAFAITAENKGTEVVAEAAAALAAASIVFQKVDSLYAAKLIMHAKQLFEFGDKYRGLYHEGLPQAADFYRSFGGYADELMWAASWLYRATRESKYMQYLIDNDDFLQGTTLYHSMHSWEDKRPGANIVMTIALLTGNYDSSNLDIVNLLKGYKQQADNFMCFYAPGSPTRQVQLSAQGLLINNVVNSQHVLNAAFIISVYSDYLDRAGLNLECGTESVKITPETIFSFSKGQMDYLLGNNAKNYSYMVGFGDKYPLKMHHRGSSIPSVKVMPAKVICGMGYVDWFENSNPNPNVHLGAFVGGPRTVDDAFIDVRNDWTIGESATYMNPGAVGLLAKLYGLSLPKEPPPPPSPPAPPSPPPSPPSPPSPPIAPFLGQDVTVTCTVVANWYPEVSMYDCFVKNIGTKYTVAYVVLHVTNFHNGSPNFQYWNINYSNVTMKATLPSYSFYLGPGKSHKFGYYQSGKAATFSVLKYDGGSIVMRPSPVLSSPTPPKSTPPTLLPSPPQNIPPRTPPTIVFPPLMTPPLFPTISPPLSTLASPPPKASPLSPTIPPPLSALASTPPKASPLSPTIPPPLSTLASPPPPKILLPPPVGSFPPPLSSNPPVVSTSQVIISQTVQSSWGSGSGTVYQYTINIYNTGPGNILSLVVFSDSFSPSGSWNINSMAEKYYYTFPVWGSYLIGANKNHTGAGYQQAGAQPKFLVVRYKTDTGVQYNFFSPPVVGNPSQLSLTLPPPPLKSPPPPVPYGSPPLTSSPTPLASSPSNNPPPLHRSSPPPRKSPTPSSQSPPPSRKSPPPSRKSPPPSRKSPPPSQKSPPPSRKSPPPSRKSPPPSRKSPPPLRRYPPPSRKSPPPSRKSPPPSHKSPPPSRKSPPPLRKSPPPVRKSPPPLRKSPPPSRKLPPPSRKSPPPRKSSPPPPYSTPNQLE